MRGFGHEIIIADGGAGGLTAAGGERSEEAWR